MTPFISSLLQTLPSITRVGSTQARVGSGSLVINKPTGVVEGDLLLACLSAQNTFTFTQPSGWTEVFDNLLAISWKRAGASEPSSYSFTVAAGSSAGVIVAYRAASFDVVGSRGGSSTAPSITLSKNDSVDLAFFMYFTAGAITAPSGMTTVESYSADAPSVALFEKLHVAAGATGIKTSGGVVGTNGIQIGLKPRFR